MKRWMSWLSPAHWADELDFVGPRVRTAPWAWLLLVAGLLSLAWALPQVQAVEADRAEAQLTLKRLQRAAHQQAVATKVAQAPTDKPSSGKLAPPLSPDAARQAAQLAQWLAYPWMQVLSQVEQAAQAEQAVMLGFSLDLTALGSRADVWPDVRLSAAVRDDIAALKWLDAQGPAAQLLGRDRLGSGFDTPMGHYDWRVEAVWSGGAP
jgi:hypothetical protein